VPRARDDSAFEFAFSKWTAAVNAGVVDDVELSVDVEDGQRLAVHLRHDTVSRFDVINTGDPYELCHDLLLPFTDW
jgi:hypothetical protein